MLVAALLCDQGAADKLSIHTLLGGWLSAMGQMQSMERSAAASSNELRCRQRLKTILSGKKCGLQMYCQVARGDKAGQREILSWLLKTTDTQHRGESPHARRQSLAAKNPQPIRRTTSPKPETYCANDNLVRA